jgi:hypothetical protein
MMLSDNMLETTETNVFDAPPPTIPPRSPLHHLEPVGVETSGVESLTSYIVRLAASHHVPVSALFHNEVWPLMRRLRAEELNAGLTRMQDTSLGLFGRILNGVTPTAERGAKALETLTLRPNLSCLTCVPWGASISNRQI